MIGITEAFRLLQQVKVLVVGDFVLDVYTKGVVERISPEAPVPVLLVHSTTESPGGAGNVALNLLTLGADVAIIGRIGDDTTGETLKQLLENRLIDTDGLVVQPKTKTSLKNRFIADGQQLIRTDYEKVIALDAESEQKVIDRITKSIGSYDLIALSDYGKGFLTDRLLLTILALSKAHGVPTIVDPKGKEFTKYNGAFLLKPNNKEAFAAANLPPHAPITDVALALFRTVSMDNLLITRGDQGMSLFTKDGHHSHFPVPKRDVMDVTGAGDTALAMIAFCLANHISLPTTIDLANIASGLAIERLGCSEITLSEVATHLLQKNPLTKIFEESSLFVLTKIIQDNPVILLCFTEEDEISSGLFHGIKEIAATKQKAKILAHVVPTVENTDFIHLLASMYEIDFVLSADASREEIIEKISPQEVVETSSFYAVDWRKKVHLMKTLWKIASNFFFYGLAFLCGAFEVTLFFIRQKLLGHRLPNYHSVDGDRLFRGGQPSADGFQELAKQGVKTIINLRVGEFNTKVVNEYYQDKLRVIHLPFYPYNPQDHLMIECLKIMGGSAGPTFVHCFHGADRTGAVIALYRIIVQNWDKERAILEMKQRGLHWWHKNLVDYILDLDIDSMRNRLRA